VAKFIHPTLLLAASQPAALLCRRSPTYVNRKVLPEGTERSGGDGCDPCSLTNSELVSTPYSHSSRGSHGRNGTIWWRRLRSMFSDQQRAGFDSLFALVSWQLRNARCFRKAASSVTDLLQIIRAQADLWIEAGAAGLKAPAQG
jgi:hypothetical protein